MAGRKRDMTKYENELKKIAEKIEKKEQELVELQKKHDSIIEEMDKVRVEGLVSLMNEKNMTFEELKTLIENR
ncbi:hypothetical protein [Enterocloster citroniae]|uniref:hypothetical protein n=1 Tax=Enterocloster citroniae TaxID=358743 RepID=UPI001D13AAD6|nr:hypothetical protein [Enterocloster citroniae]MCC3383348.1 hypothetical protein [Enterocloster citroniae]